MVAKGLAGKKIAFGGARQPSWRDIRLGPGKFRFLIWLHTALNPAAECERSAPPRVGS